MERIADIIGIGAMGILCWQDFRSRQIAWWLLPIIALVLLKIALRNNSATEVGKEFSINIFFLLIQFSLLWIWFSLKNKKVTKIIDQQIGFGDVLFMICIALAFSPANFLLFYTIGMIATLLLTIIVRIFLSTIKSEIPLAGALALPLIVLFLWRIIDPSKNFYSDEWLMQLVEYKS